MSCMYDDELCKYYEDGRCDFPSMGSGYPYDAPCFASENNEDWIQVTDRMPEEHEWIGTKMFGTTISDEVYVAFERPDGQRFTKHISFQNGKLSSSDKRLMEVWYDDAKPIAWMPLPETYKG